MKFIATSWSPNMIRNMIPHKEWDMRCHELTEEEFFFLSKGALSCLNHRGLAKILGLNFNPKHVSLSIGDTLLVTHLRGGHLPEYAEELTEEVTLEFYCYQIMESAAPLIREKISMEE